MAAFAVREARETDVDGIAQLSFTDEPAGDHDVEAFRRCWKWLHGENPCKQGKVLVGVDADERVVGYYAIVPFHFRRDGQPFASGGFVCRLLVAEALRNQLLFPQLELKLLKGYPAWGMDFAYGLINRPLVLKAHLYFKFKEIIALPVLARPVKLQNVVNRVVQNKLLRMPLRALAPIGNAVLSKLRWPSDRRVEVQRVDHFPQELAKPLNRLTRQFPIAAARTVESLNWRFAQLKDRGYKIFLARSNGALSGYVVTRKMPMKEFTSHAIVDILFAPDDKATGNALVNTALDEARAESADVCACLLNPQGQYYRFFRNRGFFRTPESFTLIVHEPPNCRHRPTEIRPADWHLTWFDHDFV